MNLKLNSFVAVLAALHCLSFLLVVLKIIMPLHFRRNKEEAAAAG